MTTPPTTPTPHRYAVTLCRQVYEYATVTVTAASADDAEREVEALIEAQGPAYHRLEWEAGDPTEDRGRGEVIGVEESLV